MWYILTKKNITVLHTCTSLILIRFACKICCGIDNILISWHDKQNECFALYEVYIDNICRSKYLKKIMYNQLMSD